MNGSRFRRPGGAPQLAGQLIGLVQIAVGTGDDVVFSDVDLNIHQGDRVALVGLNGSGKSTLLRLLCGMIEPDQGLIRKKPGLRMGYLPQDPDISPFATIGDYARHGLTEDEYYLFDRAAEGLNIPVDHPVEDASGGELRQAGLARLFARQRDIYLLDEPTNHLDMITIAWLEERLGNAGTAYVMVSHDRRMLQDLTGKTIWIDHGRIRVKNVGYEGFQDWHDETRALESRQRRRLDRRIRAESVWASEGISARRKRNQGRLRNLEELRRERAEIRRQLASIDIDMPDMDIASQLVIEALDVTLTLGSRCLIRDMTLRVLKGDRLAVIGPNGIGKTSLLDILTAKRRPDQGRVRVGKTIRVATLHQDRSVDNPNMSVREFLAGRGAHARDIVDHVVHLGRSRHVISYLKSYQFDRSMVDAPLKSLSGGELGRLYLARIMLQESDLLILDEPTNDLDMDALDMLQDTLARYPGTVVFVSHDRDFLDNVATVTVELSGDGKWAAYPGGWSVCQQQRPRVGSVAPARAPVRRKPSAHSRKTSSPDGSSLTYTERHRLRDLDDLMVRQAKLVRKKARSLDNLDPGQVDYHAFNRLAEEVSELQTGLEDLEEEWMELAERLEQEGNQEMTR